MTLGKCNFELEQYYEWNHFNGVNTEFINSI